MVSHGTWAREVCQSRATELRYKGSPGRTQGQGIVVPGVLDRVEGEEGNSAAPRRSARPAALGSAPEEGKSLDSIQSVRQGGAGRWARWAQVSRSPAGGEQVLLCPCPERSVAGSTGCRRGVSKLTPGFRFRAGERESEQEEQERREVEAPFIKVGKKAGLGRDSLRC